MSKPTNVERLPLSSALEETIADRLVDRKFIQESINLWERAIQAGQPSANDIVQKPKTIFLRLIKPLRAPVSITNAVEPRSVRTEDGFAPGDRRDIENLLDSYVESRAQILVETSLSIDLTPRKARRIWVFDEPVTMTNSAGTLKTRDEYDQEVELNANIPANIIIEEFSNLPTGSPVTRTVNGTLRGDRIVWND